MADLLALPRPAKSLQNGTGFRRKNLKSLDRLKRTKRCLVWQLDEVRGATCYKRKVLRQGRNLAFNEDTCLENKRVQ